MAEAHGQVPVEVLREAARRYAATVTLRSAANEIGLSLSGLHSFLLGTAPRPSTIRKLVRWYLSSAEARIGEDSNASARIAIGVLLGDIPESKRAAAEATLIQSLREWCVAAGVPLPAWLLGRGAPGGAQEHVRRLEQHDGI